MQSSYTQIIQTTSDVEVRGWGCSSARSPVELTQLNHPFGYLGDGKIIEKWRRTRNTFVQKDSQLTQEDEFIWTAHTHTHTHTHKQQEIYAEWSKQIEMIFKMSSTLFCSFFFYDNLGYILFSFISSISLSLSLSLSNTHTHTTKFIHCTNQLSIFFTFYVTDM